MPKKSSKFKDYPKSETHEEEQIEKEALEEIGVVRLTDVCEDEELQEEVSEKAKFGNEFGKAEILNEEERLEEEELLRDHARTEAELADEAEDAWHAEEAAIRSFYVPKWIKVCFVMGLLVMSIAVVLMVKKHLEVSQIAQREQERVIGALKKEKEAEAASRRLQQDIRKAVESFLTAENPEERLAFSRHPQRVALLMEEYYQRQDMKHLLKSAEIEIKFMDEAPQVTNPRHQHYFFLVEVTSGEYVKKLLVEVTESGRPLIDWEGFVYYRPMPWDDYLEQKLTVPIVFRCLVRANQYYLMPYEDEEKYFALELRDTKSKRGGLAYIRRDHPKFDLLKKVQENARSKQSFPFILEIEMPLPAEGTQSILVKDILAVGGVYMEPTLEE